MRNVPLRFAFPQFGRPVLLLAIAWLGAVGCSKSDEAKSADTKAVATAPKPGTEAPKCTAGTDGQCPASATCSPTCQAVATPECVACEAAGDCYEFSDNCNNPSLAPADRAICYDLLACIQTSNCFDGNTSLGACYCGSLDHEKCLKAPMSGPGAPDGACHDLILKGTPNATSQAQVLGLFTVMNHAAAFALSRVNCQKIAAAGACSLKCGFGPPTPVTPALNPVK